MFFIGSLETVIPRAACVRKSRYWIPPFYNSLWQITALASVFVFMPVQLDKWIETRDYCGAHSLWSADSVVRQAKPCLYLCWRKFKLVSYSNSYSSFWKYIRIDNQCNVKQLSLRSWLDCSLIRSLVVWSLVWLFETAYPVRPLVYLIDKVHRITDLMVWIYVWIVKCGLHC